MSSDGAFSQQLRGKMEMSLSLPCDPSLLKIFTASLQNRQVNFGPKGQRTGKVDLQNRQRILFVD